MPVGEKESRALAVAAPYWAGEAEIVRAYLDGLRTIASDLRWLHAQAFKEAYVFLTLPSDVRRRFETTGELVHPGGPAAAARVATELAHYRLIADVIAALWAPIRVPELVQLPEDRKLQRLRIDLARDGGDLAKAAAAFTEGGGGAMYAVLAGLDGGPIDRKIADAFAVIHRDELLHGPAEVHAIGRAASTADDWDAAVEMVRAISRQRLLMRNEMFGNPIGIERLEAIARGEIEPWRIAADALAPPSAAR